MPPPPDKQFLVVAPGTYVLEDDGILGNNISRLRHPDGTFEDFEHPTDNFGFFADVAGVNLVIDLADSLGTANVNIGTTTRAFMPETIVVQYIQTGGFITLNATFGITESSDVDAAPDVVADRVVFTAGTGVGVPANAIETETRVLEAETDTGGITLTNFGDVNIGNVSSFIRGLYVGTSGDILLTNFGSIILSDTNGTEVVHGGSAPGSDVTLIANGFNADIYSDVVNRSIFAQRGDILLQAGRDVFFGRIGSNANNDVFADGNLVIQAGRDLFLDGSADLAANAFGNPNGGDVLITVGRDITVAQINGNSARISTFNGGGDIVLTTGAGGALILTAPTTGTVGASGNVVVNADRVLIDEFSGMSATGTITVTTATPGRAIIVGSATDTANALELSGTEIDRLQPGIVNRLVTIGSNTAGPLTVAGDVLTFGLRTLELRSGTSINVLANMDMTGGLTLRALDNVSQASGSTIALSQLLSVFVDAIDDDPGVGNNATLSGTITSSGLVAINGNLDTDILNGSGAAERIQAFAGNDVLRGFGGSDLLDGGVGFDTMFGGQGDDTFTVDNNNDVVTEFLAEGNDSLFASVNFALAAGAEIETMGTTNALGTAAIALTGNGFAQSIFGNAGPNLLQGLGDNDNLVGFGSNDMLDGGAGNDVMRGGLGNDTMMVDSTLDQVFENVGEGDDIVVANVNYVLQAGAEIETLTNTTAANLSLTGNEFGQTINGNAGINTLDGGGGVDQLLGFGDNDVLIGGIGADVMRGHGGNDGYNVDNAGDLVFESVGEGDDTLSASVSYTLAAGVEIETMGTTNGAGTGAINLAGNDFSQSIFGNDGINVLNGDGGIDSLSGFGGNDVLIGGGGNDVLNGGADRDDYRFNTTLNALTNVDTIIGFVTVTDGISLDDAVFTALAPGALSAGAFRIGASAQDADDRIIYDGTTGALFYDADGVGGAAQVQFALLQGAPALAGSDFVVI